MAAARSTVELDFFRMENESSGLAKRDTTKKFFERKRSFRDIQGEISKINPEVVKAIIASGSASSVTKEDCDVQTQKAGKKHQIFSSSFAPYSNPGFQTVVETAPMTIFYNGAIAVFDVPHQQAENILKVAEEAAESIPDIKSDLLVENGGLPLTRRKSLRRFLEKRKERQTNTRLPYDDARSDTVSSKNGWSPANDEEKKDEAIVEHSD